MLNFAKHYNAWYSRGGRDAYRLTLVKGILNWGGSKRKSREVGRRQQWRRRRPKQRGKFVEPNWGPLCCFDCGLWTPSCVPHWCVKPPLFMSSPMARQRMTSGPHQASGPCPNAKTTQSFDLLFLVLSTEPGCIVNMSTLLYCLIIRILFIWGLVCQGKSTD